MLTARSACIAPAPPLPRAAPCFPFTECSARRATLASSLPRLAVRSSLCAADPVAGRRIANEGNIPAPAAPAGVADADEAMSRLGASIKLIAGRRPVRIEQEPAPTLEGVTATGGLVRVVYQDEEDREFVLEQIKIWFDNDADDDKRNRAVEAQKAVAAFTDRESFLRITPNDTVISAETDSTVRIRWIDADGILLALIGVDEEFLREMMGRIK